MAYELRHDGSNRGVLTEDCLFEMQKQQNVRKKQKKIVKANIPHYNVIYCSIFGSSIQKLQESARFVVPQRVAGSLGTSADLEKGGGVTGARPHLT